VVHDHDVAFEALEPIASLDEHARELPRQTFLHRMNLRDMSANDADAIGSESMLAAVIDNRRAEADESLDQRDDGRSDPVIDLARHPSWEFELDEAGPPRSEFEGRVDIQGSASRQPKRSFSGGTDRPELEVRIEGRLNEVDGVLDKPPRDREYHSKDVGVPFEERLRARNMRTGAVAPPAVQVACDDRPNLTWVANLHDLTGETGDLMVSVVGELKRLVDDLGVEGLLVIDP